MYKHLLGLALLSYLALTNVNAQDTELHTPKEMLEIMDNSSLTYEVDLIDEELDCIDQDMNLNNAYMYSVMDGEHRRMKEYRLSDIAEAYFAAAEQYFQAKELDSARHYYQLVADMHKDFSVANTYIGQTYEIDNDTNKAIEHYKKAIKVNFYDYTAHWFLADGYMDIGEVDSAIRHITIASVLNRNNPRLKTALLRIYKDAGKPYDDWCFAPQIKLGKAGDKVSIKFAQNWLGYAVARAVWEYEPGYKKQMGVTDDSYSTTQDKECLAVLAMALDADDDKNWKLERSLNALMTSLDDKLFYEYLAYEVVLVKHPVAAYYYSQIYINEIADYVLKVRRL